MQPFTSKELYMMNGGQKLYICKDGFGDVYEATAAEEAEWAQEVVKGALIKIATEKNRTTLQFAITDLVYHKYEGLEALLLKSIENTIPERQIVFAAALWNMARYKNSFEIIFKILLENRADCLNDVFLGLTDFKEHEGAKNFLISCLLGDDEVLLEKAQRTISIWAWSGLPALRENNLLELLPVENKDKAAFKPAVERVKEILKIKR